MDQITRECQPGGAAGPAQELSLDIGGLGQLSPRSPVSGLMLRLVPPDRQPGAWHATVW